MHGKIGAVCIHTSNEGLMDMKSVSDEWVFRVQCSVHASVIDNSRLNTSLYIPLTGDVHAIGWLVWCMSRR